MSQKLAFSPPSPKTGPTESPSGKWRRMVMRPSLVSLTAAAAGLSVIAHTMTIAGATDNPPGTNQPPTRMGVSIQQSMSERDRALAQRKRAIDLREQSARAAEQRLKAELQDKTDTPANNAGVGERKDGLETSQPIDDLARIYQTMKPARAAPIFAALDLDVQTQIARRMRERAIALIMANMEPAAAVRLSMALAGRRPMAALAPSTQALPVAARPLSRTTAPPSSPSPSTARKPAYGDRQRPAGTASPDIPMQSTPNRGKSMQRPQIAGIKAPRIADAGTSAPAGNAAPAASLPATTGEPTRR